MWLACVVLMVALYAVLWVVLYRSLKMWAAERGVPLEGRAARLATWSLFSVAAFPVALAENLLCGLVVRS